MSRREPLTSISSLRTAANESPLALLKQVAPSAFSTTARPGVSNRYAQVPTVDVVNHLMLRGWIPESAGEAIVNRKRQNLASWVAHTITLRHPDFQFGKLKQGDIFPTILVGNSHDTSTPFWMRYGFKRCTCDNQNVINMEEYEPIRFRHVGSATLMGKIYEILGGLENAASKIGKVITKWSKTNLDQDQKMNYIARAVSLRSGGTLSDLATINLQSFDERRRPEDKHDDLFTVYQVMQEHATRGFRTVAALERGEDSPYKERTLIRPMASTKSFVRFNEDLFALTAKFGQEVGG